MQSALKSRRGTKCLPSFVTVRRSYGGPFLTRARSSLVTVSYDSFQADGMQGQAGSGGVPALSQIDILLYRLTCTYVKEEQSASTASMLPSSVLRGVCWVVVLRLSLFRAGDCWKCATRAVSVSPRRRQHVEVVCYILSLYKPMHDPQKHNQDMQ